LEPGRNRAPAKKKYEPAVRLQGIANEADIPRASRCQPPTERAVTASRSLHRVLGLGFGLAFAFGTMVGVGILRLPGIVAAAAGTPTLVLLCWCIGGLYALMGAVSISELAAMYPEAGGFRVYARHAFGDRAGFIVGWIDWLASPATLAFAAVSAIEFLATLWPPVAQYETLSALALLALFTAMHACGVRMSGTLTSLVSATVGILLLALIVGCFLVPSTAAVSAVAGSAPQQWSVVGLLTIMPAIPALLTAYDGWYAPIYTAEESLDAPRTLPRAIIGGALVVVILYLTLNIALLRVLSIPQLAASSLPVATAAQIALPHGSATIITTLSILIVLGLINSNCITGTRVLFSLAREGWISPRAAAVGTGGTPYAALIITTLTAGAMILTGSFKQLIALFAVLILMYYAAPPAPGGAALPRLWLSGLDIRGPRRLTGFSGGGYRR
jgi:APA family basic amino acid/polyamine antiporter